MGWSFQVTCPDCDHKWEGVETSYRFDPSPVPEYSALGDGFRSWFCPRCYYRIHLPRTVEPDVWRQWYASFLTGPDARFPFLASLAAKMAECLRGGGSSIPLAVELMPVDCPRCQHSFEESGAGVPDRLICPKCGMQKAVIDDFESHCQMFRDEYGFG